MCSADVHWCVTWRLRNVNNAVSVQLCTAFLLVPWVTRKWRTGSRNVKCAFINGTIPAVGKWSKRVRKRTSCSVRDFTFLLHGKWLKACAFLLSFRGSGKEKGSVNVFVFVNWSQCGSDRMTGKGSVRLGALECWTALARRGAALRCCVPLAPFLLPRSSCSSPPPNTSQLQERLQEKALRLPLCSYTVKLLSVSEHLYRTTTTPLQGFSADAPEN